MIGFGMDELRITLMMYIYLYPFGSFDIIINIYIFFLILSQSSPRSTIRISCGGSSKREWTYFG